MKGTKLLVTFEV